jgi:hypothetical protein
MIFFSIPLRQSRDFPLALKLLHIRLFSIAFIFCFFSMTSFSQSTSDSILFHQKNFTRYIKTVGKKASQCDKKLTQKSLKALRSVKRQDEKIYRQLLKKDSVKAKELYEGVLAKYDALEQKLLFKASSLKGIPQNHFPYLDTLKRAMEFLSLKSPSSKEVTESVSNITELKDRFDQMQQVQDFLKQRKSVLTTQLPNLGMPANFKKINKEVFYYTQTLKSYKEIFSDQRKLEATVLKALNKIPAFQKFLSKRSDFTQLVGTPGRATSISVAGVQTRASVQQLVRQNYSSAIPSGFVHQQLLSANKQIAATQKILTLPDAFGNPSELPKDFRPNMQKTKPFFKRFEYGANVQFANLNRFLPSTADLALHLGYKLNDNGTVGIGSGYKLGLGKGFDNIQLTHQGMTLRSFIEWRLKGNFFLSGGYEKLYLPQLAHISVYDFNKWQQSGLIGLDKKYRVSKKVKGCAQLLFDFLSYSSIPRRQPIVFRTGWNF